MISLLCAFVLGGLFALYMDWRTIVPDEGRWRALKGAFKDYFGNFVKAATSRQK